MPRAPDRILRRREQHQVTFLEQMWKDAVEVCDLEAKKGLTEAEIERVTDRAHTLTLEQVSKWCGFDDRMIRTVYAGRDGCGLKVDFSKYAQEAGAKTDTSGHGEDVKEIKI